VTGEQVSGGQLSIVPRVSGGDGEDVVPYIGQKVVLLEEGKGKQI